MYNLVPAVGAVSATRSNFNFEELWEYANQPFGPTCPMKIEGRKVEPPEPTKGFIARTYKYMDAAYPEYRMSKKQRKLMDAWDRQYPVDRWECTRAKRIEYLQGNENPFVKNMCISKGLW